MICKSCAWEADTVKDGGTHVNIALANLLRRRDSLPVEGHAACRGDCDCAHQEVGTDCE